MVTVGRVKKNDWLGSGEDISTVCFSWSPLGRLASFILSKLQVMQSDWISTSKSVRVLLEQ